MNLLDFYRFHRASKGRHAPMTAIQALAAARASYAAHKAATAVFEAASKARDENPNAETRAAYESALKAATKTRRYLPEKTHVSHDQDKPGIAYVSNPAAVGLRLVGRVMADTPRGDIWDSREQSGWYTDPHGDTYKDGTGLCYGLVYQLPARKGQARFVAAYEFGGCDGGPVIDLGTVYTSASNAYADLSYDGSKDNDDARDAARAADSMAEKAAEKEREYQTAWALGNVYTEAREEAKEARAAALALLKERRVAMTEAGGRLPAICAAIRESVSGYVETIRDARERMAKALEGEGRGLYVYMGEDEKTAFCEAAGLDSFPA